MNNNSLSNKELKTSFIRNQTTMTTENIIEFFHKAIENVKKRFYTLTKEYTVTSMTNSSSSSSFSSFSSSFKSNIDFMIRTMEGRTSN